MAKMILFEIVLCLVAWNVLRLRASGYSSETCTQKNNECKEDGSILTQAAESESNDRKSTSKVEEALNALRSSLADFPESQQKLDEIRDWVKEQKDRENKDNRRGKTDKMPFEELKKVSTIAMNSIEKFKSKDPLKITTGVLDIVSSLTTLVDVGKPQGAVIRTLWTILGWLLTESKPQQPSVVDQLAKVVHDNIVHFNKRLQDQKYNGLKRRVSDQIFQLQRMKRGEILDDPNLWNDYVQFLGELANRFETPLPFKYEQNLTEDPDVADFVTAVVTYAEAHSCFMALLFAAKAKYTELGIAHEDDKAAVDRKMNCQSKDAKERLSFLSEKRFLTLLGRIEDGKLTKIVALSRFIRSRSLVEAVRRSLDLSPMQDLSTVESAARKVAHQSVKLKSAVGCNWFLLQYMATKFSVQFFNDVDFPMKIVSGEIGWSQGNQLKFVRDVQPRASYLRGIPEDRGIITIIPNFSTAGYIILYLNNIPGSDVEPPQENTRVIEFGMSYVFTDSKISMQDKTDGEFSRGLDTYNKRSEDEITLYFSEDGKHYIAHAEIYVCWPDRIWRFAIQDFDPEALPG